MNAAINGALALVVIVIVTIAFAGWNSPDFLARMAARCMARKESLEAGAAAWREGLTHWRDRVGVTEQGKWK